LADLAAEAETWLSNQKKGLYLVWRDQPAGSGPERAQRLPARVAQVRAAACPQVTRATHQTCYINTK